LHWLRELARSRSSHLPGDCWVLPSAMRHDCRTDFSWTPGPRRVFEWRRGLLQHRVDDAPSLLDVVLSCEQRRVADHRVAENALVRVHLVRRGMLACE